MIILLGLDGRKLLDQDNDEASLIYPDRLSTKQRILLFQSMAEQKGTPGSSRGLGEDYHLQKSLEFITYGNFKRNKRFPTAVTEGPKYPPIEHFPSSNSTLTSGSIPAEDFRPLLRLMLLTQLYVAGIAPDNFTSSLSEIEAATDCLLAAFLNGGHSSTAVYFTAFDDTLDKSMVRNCHALLAAKNYILISSSKTSFWVCLGSSGLYTWPKLSRSRLRHHQSLKHRKY